MQGRRWRSEGSRGEVELVLGPGVAQMSGSDGDDVVGRKSRRIGLIPGSEESWGRVESNGIAH